MAAAGKRVLRYDGDKPSSSFGRCRPTATTRRCGTWHADGDEEDLDEKEVKEALRNDRGEGAEGEAAEGEEASVARRLDDDEEVPLSRKRQKKSEDEERPTPLPTPPSAAAADADALSSSSSSAAAGGAPLSAAARRFRCPPSVHCGPAGLTIVLREASAG